MNRPALLLLLLCAALAPCASLDADGWTDRLGLKFRDDCQEYNGFIASVFAWASSLFGLRPHTGAVCESQEMRCPGATSVTALQVHFGRDDQYDRDYYDFKLRCGTAWQRYLGLRFESPDLEQEETVLCPGVKPASGVQVLRGRNRHGDQDFYGFKLRCAAAWQPLLGLAFDGHQETRTSTCPRGRVMRGLRVHRGFQDWGDRDSYEFQLLCEPESGSGAAPAQPRSTTFGSRGLGADETAEMLKELRASKFTEAAREL
jgi:hypothetical protein